MTSFIEHWVPSTCLLVLKAWGYNSDEEIRPLILLNSHSNVLGVGNSLTITVLWGSIVCSGDAFIVFSGSLLTFLMIPFPPQQQEWSSLIRNLARYFSFYKFSLDIYYPWDKMQIPLMCLTKKTLTNLQTVPTWQLPVIIRKEQKLNFCSYFLVFFPCTILLFVILNYFLRNRKNWPSKYKGYHF